MNINQPIGLEMMMLEILQLESNSQDDTDEEIGLSSSDDESTRTCASPTPSSSSFNVEVRSGTSTPTCSVSSKEFDPPNPPAIKKRRINAEFQRLIALPLEAKLFAQLDKHSTALLALARLKGGEMREKLAPIMHTYDQAEDIRMKRTSILKALITVPGEQPHSV
uniref:BESS domain-containing protein n=1 Tax=Knipowitschia caucasica TaxID=637954 RepID=A0AAV2L5E6_KNICA